MSVTLRKRCKLSITTWLIGISGNNASFEQLNFLGERFESFAATQIASTVRAPFLTIPRQYYMPLATGSTTLRTVVQNHRYYSDR